MRGRPKLYWCIAIASAALAQAQPVPAKAGVDEILKQARQEIAAFQRAGGENSDPAHPAEKWAQELWKWRDTAPGTPDAAKGTVEALRLLVYADRFAEVQSRADRVPSGDPAWQGMARVLLDLAARQKDYTYFFAKLESVFHDATDSNVRAAIQASLGRAWRRRSEEGQAEAAFRLAMELAASSPAGKDAEAQLYEMLHLSVGKPAPSFTATATGGARVSLADYRGKALVLVFWGTY
jgi:hypothetical protein